MKTPSALFEPSTMEMLEARIAPAGLISATYAAGTLTLSGDVFSNDITINVVGVDHIVIVGAGGTFIALNGGMAGPSMPVDGPIKNINADLGVGNDHILVNSLAIPGTLNFTGGDGNDTLELFGCAIGGALTFQGGSQNDNLLGSGPLFSVGGALNVDLGDGSNGVTLSAINSHIVGKTNITGGIGVDTVTVTSTAFLTNKGITAQLGADNNSFSLGGQDLRIGGALAVTHLDHGGGALTAITPAGELIVSGGITVNYGAGMSNTTITTGAALEVAGLLKINSTGTNDAVLLSSGGEGVIKGGVSISLGDGINNAGIGGFALVTPSISISGGAGADAINLTPASARVGTVTFALGGGSNNVVFAGSELKATGLVKMMTGSGDDLLAFTPTETNLSKGIQFLAGDGVNTLTVGGASFRSGPINANFGEHAAGVSSVAITSSSANITGSLSVTGKSGNESVTILGTSCSSGPMTLNLGDGVNSVSLSAGSQRFGAVNVTTGSGIDIIGLSGPETTIASLALVLGGGANSVSGAGGALTIAGATKITALGGDDMVSFSENQQRFGGGLQLALGDGLNSGSLVALALQSGAGIKIQAGTHGVGLSLFSLNAPAMAVNGPLTATFTGGDNMVSVFSSGPARISSVKFTSGSGSDGLSILGTGLTVGPVSFSGGDGTNSLLCADNGGTIGAVQYAGGGGTDTLTIQAFAGTAGAVNATFGTGTFALALSGVGRFTGPVTVQAATQASEFGNVNLMSASFAGPVKITTGAGLDTFNVADSIFSGACNLTTGAGNDIISIDNFAGGIPTFFRGPVAISMGAGADTLNIGNNVPTGHAEFQSTVKLDGGADADTAHVSTINFANLYPAGQPVLIGFETHD